MKIAFVATLASVISFACEAKGAVSIFVEYRLGEAGSLGANNIPQDSSGNARPIINAINGGSAAAVAGGAHAGSTHSLDTSGVGNEGWYAPNLATLSFPTDNFAFGIWARAGAAAGNQGDVLTAGGANGAYKLSLASSGWAASAHNVSWIGSANGVTGSFTADTWTHLMMVRQSGTTSFYINGIAQGTYGTAPVLGDIHLSVAPGGSAYFDGLLDEARFVTLAPTDTFDDIRSTVQFGVIPEPSSLMALTITGLALMGRRSRK
jgi:hypothetical protein